MRTCVGKAGGALAVSCGRSRSRGVRRRGERQAAVLTRRGSNGGKCRERVVRIDGEGGREKQVRWWWCRRRHAGELKK